MPFIAKNKSTGARVNIISIEAPRTVLKPGECICPLCGTDFIIRAGLITTAHFAHKQKCKSDWKTHPESAEHLAGKLFLCQQLPLLNDYKDAQIELEVPIPSIRRIADILVTLSNGWRIAHEVQLASITVEELAERTNDYNKEGIDVVWWLGRTACSDANTNWCYRVFGFALYIEFSKDFRVELPRV